MEKSLIKDLINKVNKVTQISELKYSSNSVTLRDDIDKAIKDVKVLLGTLQSLKAEIDYELTLAHINDEELI